MPAELITVVREGLTARIVIDGVELRADVIARDSVTVPVDPDEMPCVYLALTALRVDVVNSERKQPDDPADC
ncbi:hypothetical protein [Streptomyces sp. NPDC008125]|uniref:hypothetical protein n=1 Tax=Streptomyces sp. NPDC008125 TaxID=3364811 RepID=UPI0036EED6DB